GSKQLNHSVSLGERRICYERGRELARTPERIRQQKNLEQVEHLLPIDHEDATFVVLQPEWCKHLKVRRDCHNLRLDSSALDGPQVRRTFLAMEQVWSIPRDWRVT